MKGIVEPEDLTTIYQPEAFLSDTQAVAFSVLSDKDARYRWIQQGPMQRRHFKKIRPRPSKIGERRKLRPNGQPGYIRSDRG